jgi:hypothetical protein
MNDDEPPEVGEEQVYVAENVNEFVQRERWKQILEARREARDALREAPQVEAQHGRQTARDHVRAAVDAYLMETGRLLQETEAGRELWQETLIATPSASDLLALDPTEEIERVLSISPAGSAEIELGRGGLRLEGVRDYARLGDVDRVEVTYEHKLDRRGSPIAEATATAGISTPVPISRTVAHELSDLVGEVGPVDITSADDESAEWDVDDYRDGEE